MGSSFLNPLGPLAKVLGSSSFIARANAGDPVSQGIRGIFGNNSFITNQIDPISKYGAAYEANKLNDPATPGAYAGLTPTLADANAGYGTFAPAKVPTPAAPAAKAQITANPYVRAAAAAAQGGQNGGNW
ncbi:MAG: hypothetical protein ACREU2_06735 [Steroidobacteraceae bacterium]